MQYHISTGLIIKHFEESQGCPLCEIEKIVAIFDGDMQRIQFENIFMSEGYQKLFKRKEEIKRRIFGDEWKGEIWVFC